MDLYLKILEFEKFAKQVINLNEIDKLKSFDEMKKFAKKHFEYIAQGSSRIIFKLDDGTILKLAKNEKGLAQNFVESNPKMKSFLKPKMIKSSKDKFWINVEFLTPIKEKEFEKLSGMSFHSFNKTLEFDSKSGKSTEPDQDVEKNKIYKEVLRLNKEFDLTCGDLTKISSWGKSKEGKLKLIDTGMTHEIYNEFYRGKS